MNSTKRTVISLSIFGILSCSSHSQSIEKIGEWKIDVYNSIVDIYFIGEQTLENNVKEQLLETGKNWLKSYNLVFIYAFFDREFAQYMDSAETQQRVLSRASVILDDSVLFDFILKIKGGAFLKQSKEKPQGEWIFLQPKKK